MMGSHGKHVTVLSTRQASFLLAPSSHSLDLVYLPDIVPSKSPLWPIKAWSPTVMHVVGSWWNLWAGGLAQWVYALGTDLGTTVFVADNFGCVNSSTDMHASTRMRLLVLRHRSTTAVDAKRRCRQQTTLAEPVLRCLDFQSLKLWVKLTFPLYNISCPKPFVVVTQSWQILVQALKFISWQLPPSHQVLSKSIIPPINSYTESTDPITGNLSISKIV